MKKLLIVFFQMLCLFQLFGQGTLPVSNGQAVLSASHSMLFHQSTPEVTDSHPRTGLHIEPVSHSGVSVRFVTEELDEDEDEDEVEHKLVAKKHSDCTSSFFAVFYAPLSGQFRPLLTNSQAFCVQMSFAAATQRHLLFQVFRI